MRYEIEIPPNTLERAPLVKHYEIPIPVVKAILVHIPDGHKYLARLQISTMGAIMVPPPGSGDLYIRGNEQNLEFTLDRAIDGPPYRITLKGWNEDDTYFHSFFVEVV